LSDLAFHLAAHGREIVVVTSRQRYDDPRARLASREYVDGVDVHRVWSTRFGRGFLPGRAIDYATFYASALLALLRIARRGTVVVAKTDPPLISVVAAMAATMRGATLVNWVQDLFPEVAEALGMPRVPLLRRARDWSLRRARVNVVLSEAMAARVPNPVVVHNWADASLHPMPRDVDAPFTVAYSGNLGRAHEFDTILGAMHGLPDIRFVITGGGAQLARVRAEVPPNVAFQPYVAREDLGRSLSAADVHLVSLLPKLEGVIVPSKIYGVLAVARPIVFIGARDGIGRMLEENGCGIVVEPGDVDGLVNVLLDLAANRSRAAAMGARGRALYESRFAPEIALERWEQIVRRADVSSART